MKLKTLQYQFIPEVNTIYKSKRGTKQLKKGNTEVISQRDSGNEACK